MIKFINPKRDKRRELVRDILIGTALIVGMLLLFGIAGYGDRESAEQIQNYQQTHESN